jgi:hypothetical protein
VFDGIPAFKTHVTEGGDVYVELPDRVPRQVTPHMCPASAADKRHFVIIGAGPAGLAAAETLRENGFAGTITLLAKENALPYDRTKLSKNMAVALEDIELRKAPFLQERGITLRLGVSVTAVRPEAHEVVLSDGQTVRYTRLLCATGGPARTFKAPESFVIPGADLRNIFPLRDAVHAEVRRIAACLVRFVVLVCPRRGFAAPSALGIAFFVVFRARAFALSRFSVSLRTLTSFIWCGSRPASLYHTHDAHCRASSDW